MIKYLSISALILIPDAGLRAADMKQPVKVFIFSGDANRLDPGVISGSTDGRRAVFFPNEKPEKGEAMVRTFL